MAGIFCNMVQTESEYALEYISEARTFLIEATETIIAWKNILMNIGIGHPFPTENIEQYLAKIITKQELAKQFLSLQNITEREKYFQVLHNIDYLTHKYSGQIYRIISFLRLTSLMMTDIFDNNSIQQLELVQKAMTVEAMADLREER